MARYNKQFELSLDDLELIETALRQNMNMLSEEGAQAREQADSLKQINGLLGRLHNQKTFFRPNSTTYIGG